ncbi:hypothetical protein BRADI_2g02081v3 [Brachypodium distachyon]|uniref:Uncharacterized protein n=1 Tax=Brachypodium distachyon TaxID=15368 RepID=A0A2K2D6H3_BRADI|nr:hypothetical protein BRADI_2g02081v3 [Brachypodium distachyon]
MPILTSQFGGSLLAGSGWRSKVLSSLTPQLPRRTQTSTFFQRREKESKEKAN